MAYHRSKSGNLPPSPSMAKLQFKLSRIVSHHDQLKLSFGHLKSQIKIGLLEAEDVFSSLAIPLMKLVGLKAAEMSVEGRSNTIFMDANFNAQGECENRSRLDADRSSSTVEREHDIHSLQEEYTTRATMAGKELIQRQKLQLTQLVQLLKQVESCVNSSQQSMFETIDDHKYSINKFVQKAITYVSLVQHSSSTQDRNAFMITLKLLKALYDHVYAVLGSVENGVQNLINELTERMCMPMIEYVKGFKAEMTSGTCPHLLVALEEMRGVARDGRLELEQARKKVRVAEERKLEALSMLKESEERIKKMRQQLGFFIDDKKESAGHHARKKLLVPQDDQTKDDKLLWELLKKKRKYQQTESPFGPKELLLIGTNGKSCMPTTGRSSISCRFTTREYAKSESSKAQSLGSLLPLGSSPSVTTRSRKRVTT